MPRSSLRTVAASCVALAALAAPAARAELRTLDLTLDVHSDIPLLLTSAQTTVDVAPDGSFTIPASLVAGTVTLTGLATTPSDFITQGQFQFANSSAFIAGPMGIVSVNLLVNGTATLSLSPAVSSFTPQPIVLPLSPIGGGSMSTPFVASNGSTSASFRIQGAPFQLGTFMQVEQFSSSSQPTPSTSSPTTNTGVDARTASGAGTLTLVSPSYFVTNLSGPGGYFENDSAPLVGIVTIVVPESGAAALGGAAVCTLLGLRAAARRRRR